ncbi:MAG: hypothetical protein HN820_03300, partial [Candidatus Marinimicrobia bacterium]|nr:hypothetical protein [Candidatus Neomarinimicrobiota bacterium]
MRLIHFIPVMVITSIVYSQAMYVSDYNDYVGILASYDSLDSYDAENSVVVHTTTSISVAGSYIFNGTLELGIEYGKSDFKIKNDIGFENYMDGSEYSFEGGYHIKELLPVNIALRGFYKSMSFNSELLDESDSKLSEIGNGFGVEFYKSVLKDDTMELIPFVGIRKMTINSKFDDSNGDSIE